MKPDLETIAASYAFCRCASRRGESSFSASFLLLCPEKRRAMEALYAFMRHTDDLGDSPLPAAERRAALLAWRAALGRALAGDLPSPLSRAPCEAWSGRGAGGEGGGQSREEATVAKPLNALDSGVALLPALADAIARFGIPAAALEAVIDGQEMDLAVTRYETFADLAVYCEKVAAAVGRACIHVWGFTDQQALAPARSCGIAFQLTNILRDLGEDAAIDRVYLPQEDLRPARTASRTCSAAWRASVSSA